MGREHSQNGLGGLGYQPWGQIFCLTIRLKQRSERGEKMEG